MKNVEWDLLIGTISAIGLVILLILVIKGVV
jgi:cbb3-type cytochrome oxidase subunit 3